MSIAQACVDEEVEVHAINRMTHHTVYEDRPRHLGGINEVCELLGLSVRTSLCKLIVNSMSAILLMLTFHFSSFIYPS